jgi:hypothetical protein
MSSRSTSHTIIPVAVLSTAISLCAFTAGAENDPWDSFGAPAEAKSDTIDHHEADSKDPNSLEAGSHDPDEYVVDSRDPDDLTVEAGEADIVGPGRLAEHDYQSRRLRDLQAEAPDAGYEPIDDGTDLSTREIGLTAEEIVARRHLKRAEVEAREARDTYGRMMQNDYPRGEARERIVKRRDETMQALAEARRQVEAVSR